VAERGPRRAAAPGRERRRGRVVVAAAAAADAAAPAARAAAPPPQRLTAWRPLRAFVSRVAEGRACGGGARGRSRRDKISPTARAGRPCAAQQLPRDAPGASRRNGRGDEVVREQLSRGKARMEPAAGRAGRACPLGGGKRVLTTRRCCMNRGPAAPPAPDRAQTVPRPARPHRACTARRGRQDLTHSEGSAAAPVR
jgi:hypothetical protein